MQRAMGYPPLDSLSVSEDLDARIDFHPDRATNYKPLVALNIDIGETTPVKIYVYDFTDPWKRAYEFLKTYDLPEEMHEDIAILIANAKEAKEKELRLQRLAEDKRLAMTRKQKQSLGGLPDKSRRQSSCEMRVGGSASKQRKSEMILVQDSKQTGKRFTEREMSLGREKTFGSHTKTSEGKMTIKQQVVEGEGQRKTQEKSNILDSTTLLSSASEKTRPGMKASPFESALTDLELSGLRLGDSPEKRTTIESRSTMKSKEKDVKLIDDQKVKSLFDRLDYEGGGLVRSYDVYLSDLPADLKIRLQAVLSQHDGPEAFKSFDLVAFAEALEEAHFLINDCHY